MKPSPSSNRIGRFPASGFPEDSRPAAFTSHRFPQRGPSLIASPSLVNEQLPIPTPFSWIGPPAFAGLTRDAEDAEVKEFLNNREIPIIQKTPQPSADKTIEVTSDVAGGLRLFLKIGISRFLERNHSLRSLRLCGEIGFYGH